LIIGHVEGRAVACLLGKPALLDGYPAQLVVLPVRLLWLLGCRSLLYTNTVGAINPTMRVGDFVAIRNHINFYGTNPLIGEANDQWGERWFDMAYPYDRELTATLHQVARERGITLHEGVYFGTLGPSFETAAEIEMAGRMGADVVGMTTIMEVIAARQLGMSIACIGFVSNLAAGVEGTLVHNADVLEAARPAYERYTQLMRGMLPHMP
jgi:purine-nucleoside phosphorylase